MTNTEDLAAGMREAIGNGPVEWARFLVDVWAPRVQITHTPPMGNDETVDGATLGPNEVALFEEMVRLVPDYRQEDVDVRVDGDEIVVDETLVGTLPDGTVHRAPLRYRFTIENGRIVKTNGIYDAAVVAPFGRVVAAAGHRTPDKMS